MKNSFASRIKELRTSLRKTQSEFASSIGTSQNALSGYENHDRIPSYDILVSIAKTYNVSIDWLCGLSDKKRLDGTYETYNDIFRTLIGMLAIKYTDNNSPTKGHYLFHYHGTNGISFDTKDTNFDAFFHEWIKVKKLHSDGTIDDDLYNTWLEKEFSKYNFPITGLPEFMSD